MATLINTYHNTEYNTRKRPGDRLSLSTIRRMRFALCGVGGCSCGGIAGERDPDLVVIPIDEPYTGRLLGGWLERADTYR